MLRTKVIGRQQTDHGVYNPSTSYGKKFQVQLYGCVWESLHDNNNTAPATLNTQAGTITPNTVDWKKVMGSTDQWLIDNGYKPVSANNVKDGNQTQHEINAAVAGEIGTNSTPESIKGRITDLESAVGDGGSVDERIAEEGARHYLKSETYTKEEVNGLVSTPHQEYVTVADYASLPASGSTDTIYRVSNYDGTQVATGVYSEYAWDGTQYVFLAAKSSVDEVFDITVYNNNTKYADLAAALGVDGANVPADVRRGGMSIKFVHTSDNKYVQYLYHGTSTAVADFTNTANWEKMNLEEEVSQLGKKESDDYYINLAYGAGINESVNMETTDRFVMFPIKVKPGDVLEWSASDSGGATMIVSLHYGDGPADYITLSSSPFIIDNAHTYKAIRFWKEAISVSVVTYAFKINTLSNVEKEISKIQVQDSLFANTAVDLEIGEVVNVGSAVADPNHLRSDFIPLVGIERLAYHLGGMSGVVSVSFYTAKDFSTQIQSANIMGTAPIGAAQTIEGVLLKSEFPAEAQYVVFCSVRSGQYYTNDGEIHASTSTYIVQEDLSKLATNILYNREFNQGANIPEWIGVSSANIDGDGIEISSTGAILNKEYGLAQRTLSVFCTFTNTTLAKLTAYATEDTILLIDCANKTFNLNNLESVSIPFFDADHKYNVIIERDYQKMRVSIIDMFTGNIAEHTYVNNGTGGVGQGAEGVAYITGMLHDSPKFDCVSGGSWHISKLQMLAKASNYDVMFYGDSVTEGEAYFPTEKFPKHWIQQIISKSSLKCVASGRGGGQISGVISRITNELPFVKSKYVVVTIGTNGGNTEENLSQLVEYIISVGSIPILNHIPCNESGTQIAVNALIDTVRAKYGIKGADFDLCTSLAGDGVSVNTDEMWWENYSSTSNIYHHPNVKGSTAMFAQALKDIPEIFG